MSYKITVSDKATQQQTTVHCEGDFSISVEESTEIQSITSVATPPKDNDTAPNGYTSNIHAFRVGMLVRRKGRQNAMGIVTATQEASGKLYPFNVAVTRIGAYNRIWQEFQQQALCWWDQLIDHSIEPVPGIMEVSGRYFIDGMPVFEGVSQIQVDGHWLGVKSLEAVLSYQSGITGHRYAGPHTLSHSPDRVISVSPIRKSDSYITLDGYKPGDILMNGQYAYLKSPGGSWGFILGTHVPSVPPTPLLIMGATRVSVFLWGFTTTGKLVVMEKGTPAFGDTVFNTFWSTNSCKPAEFRSSHKDKACIIKEGKMCTVSNNGLYKATVTDIRVSREVAKVLLRGRLEGRDIRKYGKVRYSADTWCRYPRDYEEEIQRFHS